MRALNAFQRSLDQNRQTVGVEPETVLEPLGRLESAACVWRLPSGDYCIPADSHLQILCLLDGDPPIIKGRDMPYDPARYIAIAMPGVPIEVHCPSTALVCQVLIEPKALLSSGRRVEFLEDRSLPERRLLCVQDPFAVQYLTATIYHNRSLFETSGAFRDSFTELVCMHLLHTHGSEGDHHNPEADILRPAMMDRLDRYLDSNLERKIATEDMASLTGLSMFYFSRKFKLTTGLSPYEYVLVRRVQRARSLLLSSDHSIAEIALETGFSSQSHFTTVFKQVLGQTPGKFRESHNEKRGSEAV